MRRFLTKAHRWLGFPFGLLFLITFATGFITAIDELTKHLSLPSANYQNSNLEQQARALHHFVSIHNSIRAIKMPTPSMPFYQVLISEKGQRGLFVYGIDYPHKELHHEITESAFFDTVLQLHRNYLLGRENPGGIPGNQIAAWVGLIALILSLVGLWLWWPLRKTFALKHIIPQGNARKHYYFNHMTAGVITLIAIMVLAMSGAGITYRDITKNILGVEEKAPLKSPSMMIDTTTPSWLGWLKSAYQIMPDGQLQQVLFPRPTRSKSTNNNSPARSVAESVYEFRFVTSSDWLGLANSTVSINQTQSTISSHQAFSELTLGEKIYRVMVPLHTGRNMGLGYLVIVLAFSLLGSLMVASGLISFLKKTRRKKTRTMKTAL